MKICKFVVMYKGINERAGGTFKNEKGQDVKYDSAYVINFDDIDKDTPEEKKLKFPANNDLLYDKFSDIKPYTQVLLTCQIVLGSQACKLVPVDVEENFDQN